MLSTDEKPSFITHFFLPWVNFSFDKRYMRKKSTWNTGEGKILKTYNTWTNSKRILLGDSPHEHDVVIKTFQLNRAHLSTFVLELKAPIQVNARNNRFVIFIVARHR